MSTPGWVLDRVADAVRAGAAAIGPSADGLAADADGLVRDGARLAGAVVTAVEAVGDEDRLAALAAAGVPGAAIPTATASRRLQAQAVGLLDALVRTAAVIALARRAGATAWASREAAYAGRDAVCERIDGWVGTVGDAPYAALQALRAAVVGHVEAIAPSLARTERVTPAGVTPSVVLAYDVLGDATRGPDLAAYARAPRPGLMRGPVEILVPPP